MRAVLPALALAALALLPVAAAQEDDGCLQSNPCLIDVEVDEQGIASVSIVNLTSGDWFTLSVGNLDERSHTVTLAGHGVSVQVDAYGLADSSPFQAGEPGSYALGDQPTGDEATLRILEGDVVDAENGSTSGSGDGRTGLPAPPAALVLLALLAFALLGRRDR